MQSSCHRNMLALNSLTPYIRLQSFQKLRIASDRLLTRQRLRLLDWSVEHAEEVMCRTGCERDQVSEYHFAEYADHRYLSGHPKRCWCHTEAGPIGQSMHSAGRTFTVCARKDNTVSHLGHINYFCHLFFEGKSVSQRKCHYSLTQFV